MTRTTHTAAMATRFRSSICTRVALGIAVAIATYSSAQAAPTSAQQARAKLSAAELKMIRGELAGMRSPNRWPPSQQDRFKTTCVKGRERDASINGKTCECMLEVVMARYATLGDYTKALVDGGGQADEQMAGMTGLCLVAHGS